MRCVQCRTIWRPPLFKLQGPGAAPLQGPSKFGFKFAGFKFGFKFGFRMGAGSSSSSMYSTAVVFCHGPKPKPWRFAVSVRLARRGHPYGGPAALVGIPPRGSALHPSFLHACLARAGCGPPLCCAHSCALAVPPPKPPRIPLHCVEEALHKRALADPGRRRAGSVSGGVPRTRPRDPRDGWGGGQAISTAWGSTGGSTGPTPQSWAAAASGGGGGAGPSAWGCRGASGAPGAMERSARCTRRGWRARGAEGEGSGGRGEWRARGVEGEGSGCLACLVLIWSDL